MPVTVIVGGQFGSEGKGKVAHFLAREMEATVAIRVGGPNSGHTVIDRSGRAVIFKQLPTAALLPDVYCVLPAGSYIRLDILQEEIRTSGIDKKRILIDPNAVVITDREVTDERESLLRSLIGSTQSGTGSAVIARAARLGGVKLARDEEALQDYVGPVIKFLRDRLDMNERVLIEGTQGFGLSLLHSPHYPFATSRDTTAAGFISEAGLSPLDVDDVVMVIRAFPIRVAGNSGPLPQEITWSDITLGSNSSNPIIETTSVTRSVRRVAKFDAQIVRNAIKHNQPTSIILNHADYCDNACYNGEPTLIVGSVIKEIEKNICRKINYIGTGPATLVLNEMVTRRQFTDKCLL